MAFSFLRSVSTTFNSIRQVHHSRVYYYKSVMYMYCCRDQCFKAAVTNTRSAQNSYHSLAVAAGSSNIVSRLAVSEVTPGNCWSLISVRTNTRDHFPRPSERKRLHVRFAMRMKTRGGRAIIMRRYLKGRHVLSH